MVQFEYLCLFLSSGEDFVSALRPKLVAVLDDQNQSRLLQMKLAATINAGGPFVKATYHLEKDSSLAFESYEIIATVQASMHNNHHPNVTAVARQLSAGNPVVMNLMVQYALSHIQPGLQYFTTQLEHSLRELLTAFEAARPLNSQKVAEILPTASHMDDLASFPFVTSAVLSDLKAELPSYVAKADGFDSTFAVSGGRKINSTTLPHWSALACQVLLVQPSSAAEERVFSLPANSFGDQQTNALQDYVKTSIMLQYNKH